MQEIETRTKREVLDRINEAYKAKDYETTLESDGSPAIMIDGVKILLWDESYYCLMLSQFTVRVAKICKYATDEDREIHKAFLGMDNQARLRNKIEAREKELAALRSQLDAEQKAGEE